MNKPDTTIPIGAACASRATEHPYRWVMLAAGWLVYFGFGLMVYSLGPLVPQITRDLGISHTAMGFALGVWQLVYIGAAIACGAFLDRYGVRIGFLAAGLVIAASGALRAAAHSYATLLVAVGLFGIGGPLISSGVPKLSSQWFSGAARGRAMGLIITGSSLGGVAALMLTPSTMLNLMHGDWRHVVLAYAGAMFAVTLLWLAVSRHPLARAVDRGEERDGATPQLQTIRVLLGLRAVLCVLAMSIANFAFNHGFSNWLPELLRAGGMAADQAGYWATIPVLVGIVLAPLVGQLSTPQRRTAILSVLLGGAFLATLLMQFAHGPLLAVALALQGFSRGSLTSVLLVVLIDSRGVGVRNAGAASGLYFTAGEIGGMLGPFVIGLAYDMTGSFAAGLGVMSLMMVSSLVMLVLLARAS
jgi:MFS family permease